MHNHAHACNTQKSLKSIWTLRQQNNMVHWFLFKAYDICVKLKSYTFELLGELVV